MIEGPAFVTPHAIAQFRARIADLPEGEARTAILAHLAHHVVSVRPSPSGRAVVARVRHGRFAFRAVVGPGEGPLPAVLTILRSRP